MDNSLLDFILALADKPEVIAAPCGAALLVVLLWRSFGRSHAAPARRPRPSTSAPSNSDACTNPDTDPPTVLEQPKKGSIEVTEVDPLAEVAVYIEFGYLDQAEQTLRWYVDGKEGARNLDALRKLLQVYQRMERIDDYGEILERLSDLGQDLDFVRKAALAGLAVDRTNLGLRVLAESRLGLGPEKLDEILGPDVNATTAQPQSAPQPEAKAMPAAPRPTAAARGTSENNAGNAASRLVAGEAPLGALSREEKAVLYLFAEPAREAGIHLAAGDLDSAAAALQRAIAAEPKTLANFTELLKVHHGRRQIEEYARTLWRLYAVLNGAGRPLRDRLLSIGFTLGSHPLLEALAQATDSRQVEAAGRQFGLLAAEPAPARKFQLVQASGEDEASHIQESNTDILEEVDSYLEFGQTEQALDTLEAAVIHDPTDARLYPPLLELYDRMDELTRFTALAGKIKKLVQRPPEEIGPMMLSLYERLKQRKQETLA